MVNEQPEALRLAEWMEWNDASMEVQNEAAAELRRLHEANTELLAALKAVVVKIHAGATLGAMKDAQDAINKAERTTT